MNTTALNASTRTLSAPRSTRLAAFALSACLTLAMLAGVNGLALHEAGTAMLAQSSAHQG